MASPNLALSLHSEIINLLLFFYCIVKVLFMCGFVAVPFVLIGHEAWKRRMPRG